MTVTVCVCLLTLGHGEALGQLDGGLLLGPDSQRGLRSSDPGGGGHQPGSLLRDGGGHHGRYGRPHHGHSGLGHPVDCGLSPGGG